MPFFTTIVACSFGFELFEATLPFAILAIRVRVTLIILSLIAFAFSRVTARVKMRVFGVTLNFLVIMTGFVTMRARDSGVDLARWFPGVECREKARVFRGELLNFSNFMESPTSWSSNFMEGPTTSSELMSTAIIDWT